MFKDFSTWRVNDIVVSSKQVGVLDFLDTKPNQFIVQNPNNVKLFIGIGNIPTEDNYEYTVNANTTSPIGRPTQTGKLYIYNSGMSEVKVKVFSVYLPFDMATLSSSNISIENAQISTDGIVRGFASGVQLPAGSNNIGNVGLTSLPLSYLKALSDWATNDGAGMSTQLEDLLTLLSEVKDLNTHIHNKIRRLALIEMPQAFEEVNTTFENNVVEIEYTATEDGMFCFNYLINDAPTHFNINVNGTAILTVLEGEKISDWKMRMSAGDVLTVTGTDVLMRGQHYYIPDSLIFE